MEISWHEAKRQYPNAVFTLLNNSQDMEEVVAFNTCFIVEDDTLFADDNFVPCDSIQWVEGTGWIDGNYPDDYDVVIRQDA